MIRWDINPEKYHNAYNKIIEPKVPNVKNFAIYKQMGIKGFGGL